MERNRCVDSAHNLGCGANVLPEMDRRCSGLASCLIKLPDDELQEKQSCPKDTIGYLEAEYTCLKGERFGYLKAEYTGLKDESFGYLKAE